MLACFVKSYANVTSIADSLMEYRLMFTPRLRPHITSCLILLWASILPTTLIAQEPTSPDEAQMTPVEETPDEEGDETEDSQAQEDVKESIDALKDEVKRYRSLEEQAEQDAQAVQDAQATQEAPPVKSEPLTPVQQVDQKFGVAWALEQEKLRKEQATKLDQNRTYWLVAEDAVDPPQIDWNKPTDCLYRDGIEAELHIQCDHQAKTCLVAEAQVFKPRGGDGGELVPTSQRASRVNYCTMTNMESDLELLRTAGYTLQAALLEAPYGYKRDWRGRIFQRYFDLRSRTLIGVGYTGFLADDTFSNSLSLETRSTYEHYSTHRGRRHRFNFLEGKILLDPLRINAKLFEYTMGRSGREPLLYITEFFGKPSRHDIYMNVGWGVTLLNFDYRAMERDIEPAPADGMPRASVENQKFLDILQFKLQWDVMQGAALEDYVGLQLGGGLGSRLRGDEAAYVYPEIGVRGAWLASPRGLVELSTQGTLRYAVEPTTDTTWIRATAQASAEWVFLSVSDQPISLYVTPQADWLEYQGGGESLRELRVTSGIRFSLFTPAPEDPANYQGNEH